MNPVMPAQPQPQPQALPAASVAPLLGPYMSPAITLGGLAISVFLFARYDGDLSFKNQLLALVAGNLGLLPASIYFSGGRKSDFPIFELLCAWYSLSLGWSSFFTDLDWYELDQDTITGSYLIGIGSMLTLFLGFYFTPQAGRIRLGGIGFTAPTPLPFMYLLGLGFSCGTILMTFLGLKEGTFEQIRVAFSSCGLILMWLYYFKPGTRKEEKLVILGVTSMVFLIQALAASIKPLIIPLVAIATTYWRIYHKVPLRLIVIAVLLYITINPVKVLWRQKVNFLGHQQVSIVDNITAFKEAFADYYFGDNVGNIEGAKLTQNRVSDINVLAKTVAWTPKYVPYWDGESLKSLPYALIPRFIWPSKPKAQYANIFGRRYELIGPLNFRTLISTAWMTDLFVNFGEAGAFIGMWIIGWAVRLVQDSFGARLLPDMQFAVGVAAAGQLYNGGENLALIWGALPLRLIMLVVAVNFAYRFMYRDALRYGKNAGASPIPGRTTPESVQDDSAP